MRLSIYRIFRSLAIIAALTSCVIQAYAQDLEQKLSNAFDLTRKGDHPAALSLFKDVTAQAMEQKDTLAEARARIGAGLVLNRMLKYGEAREDLFRALEILSKTSEHSLIGQAYNSLGFGAWGVGDLKSAADFYGKAAAAYEADGNLAGTASTLYSRAFVTQDPQVQKQLAEEALQAARRVEDPLLEGKALHLSGDLFRRESNFAPALSRLEEAAAILEKIHAGVELARVWTSMGVLYRQHGLPEKAIELYRRALAVQEAGGDRQFAIQSLGAIGLSYGTLGEFQKAVEFFQQALDRARETGVARIIAYQMGQLGYAYLELGRYDRAIDLLRQGLEVQTSQPLLFWLSRAYQLSGQHAKAMAWRWQDSPRYRQP
jgi:tetratricopeptide (TPR) repeat protein